MTLFLFSAPGCSGCVHAARTVARFARQHPEIECCYIDLTTVRWESGAQGITMPKTTPSYALQRFGRVERTLEGKILSLRELEQWVVGL